jgi:hypothetical protein
MRLSKSGALVLEVRGSRQYNFKVGLVPIQTGLAVMTKKEGDVDGNS